MVFEGARGSLPGIMLRPLLARSPGYSRWEDASLPFIRERVSQAGGVWLLQGPWA